MSENLSTPKVTFVGIGAIGLPMAARVAAAGFDLTAVDFSAAQRTAAQEHGLRAASSAASANEADAVIVMVATGDQLRSAALGPEELGSETQESAGLIAAMRPGASLIVMSTVGPEAVQTLVEPARERGIRLVDAPVTGGVARAAVGSLRLFVSADSESIDENRELLESMGTIVECGNEIGDGQAFKAVNQLLCSVHIVAAAEALALAQRLGLDPAQVLEAVAEGAAGSFMLSDRGPRMLQGPEAQVASAVRIFVKDTSLVSEIAGAHGFEAPLLEAARAKYLEAADAGLARRDDSQVIATYQR
ncbi:NAD(P)-dependent oxidoreductase [Nesterenkonia sp. E16_7]|uniref:NAD(P)-dependent oxidoreductase n=1 Tax=unclassified Nesterenkonia TaxID=2629769 RepID=UPI001A9276B4|nr:MULTISPECIES: NAD(P)-dependent oxidoreductase [unclassified Nesterenkonia]MBO0594631.1 NAD(P)-dependent oxidoreductase [Nesterenkonia sp. E16_10]MBO0598084.1 NAD(P)-dependent oxidoreductase [Nesterenkonia sp. E16_7]